MNQNNRQNPWSKESPSETLYKVFLDLKLFYNEKSFIELLTGSFVALVYVIHMVSSYPIFVLFFTIFIFDFTLLNFLELILASFLQYIVSFFTVIQLKQVININGLINYLSFLKNNEIKITAYNFTDYINDSKIAELIKEFYSSNGNDAVIGKVLYAEPKFGVIAQYKGFHIDYIHRYKPDNEKGKTKRVKLSIAVLRAKPEKLTSVQKFSLFHEIAHLTDFAQALNNKQIGNVFYLIFFTLLCIVFNDAESSFMLTLPFSYFIFIIVYYNGSRMENLEEFFCDGFAITSIEKLEDIETVKRCLKRFLSEDRYSNIEENLMHVYGNSGSNLGRLNTILSIHKFKKEEVILNTIFFSFLLIYIALTDWSITLSSVFILIIIIIIISNILEIIKTIKTQGLPDYIFSDK